MAWMTANWPMPGPRAASLRTATRDKSGAISLSNSSHFPARLYSNCVKPVTLPPGCAMLSIKPEPTGSITCRNTIGISRVARTIGPTTRLPEVTITSGAEATNSATNLGIRPRSLPAQR